MKKDREKLQRQQMLDAVMLTIFILMAILVAMIADDPSKWLDVTIRFVVSIFLFVEAGVFIYWITGKFG